MKYFLLALLVSFAVRSAAQETFASVLQDSMVIQQNKPFTVWGKAPAGHKLEVRADWTSPVTVTTDDQGEWSAIIPVPAVQRGDFKKHSIWVIVSEQKAIVLRDLLIGEVWLCSGQSNMQFSMITVKDSAREIAAANYPNLRLFNTDLNFSGTPLDAVKGRWTACSPQSVAKFSAVGFYMGRKLLNDLDVPVGIIFTGIGASAAQAYVPREALKADTQLDRVYLEPYLSSPKSKEVINGGFSFEKVTRPYLLYNAMIHPFIHLSIRGICWYQGESNRMERESYTNLTQTMIKSWRHDFAQGQLPFYYVQVAPFFYDKEDPALADYAFFREAQERISTLNNTAMVLTMDVGESRNLHPINKKPVGERLAATAENRIYNMNVVYRGPQYQHIEIRGRDIHVYFEPWSLADGLNTNDGQAPNFFELAGADKVFHPAEATIEGDHIVVKCDKVRTPVAVRYAFTNYPVTNLQNGAGWPAVPFRTDNWTEQ